MAQRDRGATPPALRRTPLLPQVLGIDPRSLAVWRIAAGLLLLADLGLRARHLTALYTDLGVMPRDLVDPWYRQSIAPLFFWNGSPTYVSLLFLLGAACAVLMALGLWTRVATLGSWLLVVALHTRNPHVLNFGDEIVRQMLFWSIFLPLGQRWSVDAIRRPAGAPSGPVVSVATAAALLQLWAIYFVGALLKSGPDWHENATAIYYSLQQDWLARPLGIALREHTAWLETLTRLTLRFEYVAPFLLFVPARFGRLRTGVVTLFVGFHLGLVLCLDLGIFPWFMFSALALFLPAWFWDVPLRRLVPARLAQRPPRPHAGGTPSTARRLRDGVSTVLAAAFLLIAAVDNVHDVRGRPLPAVVESVDRWFQVQQDWIMYAPNVPRRDGWFVVVGHRADGSTVDLLSGSSEVRWTRPPLVSATPPSPRWGNYLFQLQSPRANVHRYRYAGWLCRSWNADARGGRRLTRVELTFVDETTPPAYEPPRAQPRKLLDHRCE